MGGGGLIGSSEGKLQQVQSTKGSSTGRTIPSHKAHPSRDPLLASLKSNENLCTV